MFSLLLLVSLTADLCVAAINMGNLLASFPALMTAVNSRTGWARLGRGGELDSWVGMTYHKLPA